MKKYFAAAAAIASLKWEEKNLFCISLIMLKVFLQHFKPNYECDSMERIREKFFASTK